MFSREVRYVASTRIFARRVSPQRQTLVYQMEISLDQPVAMILPLPTWLPANEADVHFVSIKKYENFFDEVALMFPPRVSEIRGDGSRSMNGGAGGGSRPLIVREIGDFVASFVPSQADFKRLDPRFVLGPGIWKQLPQYTDYGFAVFQLKAPRQMGQGRYYGPVGGTSGMLVGGGGREIDYGNHVQVHPMALSFATRYPDRLYFPTVHVHDGKVHKREEFDHILYAQPEQSQRHSGVERTDGWLEGTRQPGRFIHLELTKNMVDRQATVLRREVSGLQKNDDIWLPG